MMYFSWTLAITIAILYTQTVDCMFLAGFGNRRKPSSISIPKRVLKGKDQPLVASPKAMESRHFSQDSGYISSKSMASLKSSRGSSFEGASKRESVSSKYDKYFDLLDKADDYTLAPTERQRYLERAFFQAVKYDDIMVVENFLKSRKFDPLTVNGKVWMVASVPVLKYLEKTHQISHPMSKYAFEFAVNRGDVERVRYLMSLPNLDPSSGFKSASSYSKKVLFQGDPRYEMMMKLLQVSADDGLQIDRKLLSQWKDTVKPDSFGSYLITESLKERGRNSDKIGSLLLKKYPHLIKEDHFRIAAEQGKLETMKVLINSGKVPVSLGNNYAARKSIDRNDKEMLDFLLPRIDLFQNNAHNVLRYALSKRNSKLVTMILKRYDNGFLIKWMTDPNKYNIGHHTQKHQQKLFDDILHYLAPEMMDLKAQMILKNKLALGFGKANPALKETEHIPPTLNLALDKYFESRIRTSMYESDRSLARHQVETIAKSPLFDFDSVYPKLSYNEKIMIRATKPFKSLVNDMATKIDSYKRAEERYKTFTDGMEEAELQAFNKDLFKRAFNGGNVQVVDLLRTKIDANMRQIFHDRAVDQGMKVMPMILKESRKPKKSISSKIFNYFSFPEIRYGLGL